MAPQSHCPRGYHLRGTRVESLCSPSLSHTGCVHLEASSVSWGSSELGLRWAGRTRRPRKGTAQRHSECGSVVLVNALQLMQCFISIKQSAGSLIQFGTGKSHEPHHLDTWVMDAFVHRQKPAPMMVLTKQSGTG